MRMNELLSTIVSPDDGACSGSRSLTLNENNTGSSEHCKLSFSGNNVFDLLR